MKNDSTAWYALRRTLPPWKFDSLLSELEELAPRFKVDEIIIKIDTEEFSHGHPSLDWARSYQEKLWKAKERLSRIGILYSMNKWIKVGN